MTFNVGINDRNKTGVYMIENVVNSKKYIGKTEDSFKTRFLSHEAKLRDHSHNKKLTEDCDRYGIDSFVFSILEVCNDADAINELEKYYIKLFDTVNCGYNTKRGGDGFLLPESTKMKMRASSKHRKMTEEMKQKLKASRAGCFTDEVKRKMSEAKINHDHPLKVLNADMVAEIKKMLMNGVTQTDIAKHFGIPFHDVKTVRSRKAWNHVHVDGFDEYMDENKPIPKLNKNQVLEIRELLEHKHTAQEISEMLNISVNVVYRIKENRIYHHIEA